MNFCSGSRIEGKDFIFISKSPNMETFVNSALLVLLVFVRVICLVAETLYSATFLPL